MPGSTEHPEQEMRKARPMAQHHEILQHWRQNILKASSEGKKKKKQTNRTRSHKKRSESLRLKNNYRQYNGAFEILRENYFQPRIL